MALTHYGVAGQVGSMGAILGRRFKLVFDRIQRLKKSLEKILDGTKEMSTAREKISAVAIAVEYIIKEISLCPEPNVSLLMIKRNKEEHKPEAMIATPLISHGMLKSEPHFEELALNELNTPAHKANFKAEGCFLDEENVLFVPLIWGSERLGSLRLERYAKPAFDPEEVHFIDTLANSLALALVNIEFIAETAEKTRLEAEIQTAETVQLTLLPKTDKIRGVKIEAYFKAAAKVGGDWYGYYLDERNNRLYLYLGDVTGHGIPSALVTGVVCGAIYGGETLVELIDHLPAAYSCEQHLIQMATSVNKIVFNTGRLANRIMTMAFLGLDLGTGQLTFLNTGQNIPYVIVDTTKKASPLCAMGCHLGYSEQLEYEITTAVLKPGDAVFLYTDGLIENTGPDKAVLKDRKLRKLLGMGGTPLEINTRLISETNTIWQNVPPDDDVTFVTVQWNGPTLPIASSG
jgi:serine phosphatase RsbU (regulator of sigma subunit)